MKKLAERPASPTPATRLRSLVADLQQLEAKLREGGGAGRINQVDDRHMRSHGNFLSAQDLLDCLRPPRSGFHRSIVGDNYNFPSADAADRRDYTGPGRATVILIVSDEQTNLLRILSFIKEPFDALTRSQFSRFVLLLNSIGAAAFTQFRFQLL